ncbi:haloalkane dehalogenase [Catenuloplanes nepalensis]|uniref:Haloalkane dehalogenase n=1 Tax=Catenuloplanes nepalensis TaxID=587533 RepID=A0ABT9MKV1_9ACTN|nr:haloalkane dehalogenase [Catenuloplanes nepalensis]MDP9792034.1 haloalkane dehalogenase [Catenuloplanes nepalensis]
MHYTDAGEGGRPVVLLHGNPTSSHIWRHVIPHLTGHGRVLAPDLIGMGRSERPELAYRFDDHARHLEAWCDALRLDDVTFVGHDWGGALALDLAARHPGRVAGVALVETFLRPMTWDIYAPAAVELFQRLRTPGEGERMVLDENWFIETSLRLTIPDLSDEDLAVYRAPFPDRESRRPLLQWPREIPIDGEPADVHTRMVAFGEWMATTPEVPKLLMLIEPSTGLVQPATERWARETIAALEVESIGKAGHQAPEQQPDAIGRAVSAWLDRHGL